MLTVQTKLICYLYASLWFPVRQSVWPNDMTDKDVWYLPWKLCSGIGLQKNRSLVSLYDRTGVCTIRTLIKNDQNDLRTGTRAEFRPFSEALNKTQFYFLQIYTKLKKSHQRRCGIQGNLCGDWGLFCFCSFLVLSYNCIKEQVFNVCIGRIAYGKLKTHTIGKWAGIGARLNETQFYFLQIYTKLKKKVRHSRKSLWGLGIILFLFLSCLKIV